MFVVAFWRATREGAGRAAGDIWARRAGAPGEPDARSARSPGLLGLQWALPRRLEVILTRGWPGESLRLLFASAVLRDRGSLAPRGTVRCRGSVPDAPVGRDWL